MNIKEKSMDMRRNKETLLKNGKIRNQSVLLPKISLLLLLFSLVIPTFSQTVEVESKYSFKRYTLHDGLPDMKNREIFQDRQGFIWLGMIDGFARFNGINFQFYHPEIQSTIFGIVADETGNPIFKGSRFNHRLSQFEDSVISVKLSDTLYYNTTNSRQIPFPYGIYENLAGDKKYLAKEINDSLVIQQCPEAIHQIDYGKVYFDTTNQLMIFPGENVLIYEMSSGRKTLVEGLSAECFVKNSRNGILALGQEGIYSLNLVDGSYKTLIDYDFDYNLMALEDKDGTFIICDYNCIYRFDGVDLEKIATLSLIRDIIFDFEGNLWVATYTGLYNFFQLKFKNYFFPDADVVMSMAEDEDSTLFFSTLNGALISKKDETFKQISYPKFGYPIFSFTPGAGSFQNRHYFPLPIGLMIQEKGDFQLADIPNGNPRRVHVLPNENILFVLKNIGVFECSPDGKVVSFFSTETLQQNITDVVCDKDGRKIVIGVKGVTVVNKDSAKLVPNLQTNVLHVACLDRKGGIWMGGESNLNLFQGDSMVAVYEFKNNSIKDIILSKTGWMVIATKLGIAFFNPDNYYETDQFDYLWYDHGNGITGLDPHTFGLFEQRNGMVWMLSSDCAVSFPLEKLVSKVQPPLLHILSLESSSDNVNGIHHDISKPIALPYDQNNVFIRFIGLKYSASHNIRYYVRLKGFQNEWVEYGNREIIYSNLLPGNYTFEIYADAGTNDSKTEIQTLDFEIKPAFWQLWWFILLIVSLFVGIAVGITIYLLKRHYDKQTQRLKIEMQLNELRIKSIRLKSIPHFNANVLAAIEYYVMNMSKEEANRLLNIYANFTNRTLRDVENASRSLADEIEYVTLYLQLEKLRFRDKFDYTISVDERCDTAIHLPNMILHTYCENAVKHGFSGTKKDFLLQIKAEKHDDYVKISVEDNGIGRKAAAMQKKQHSTKQGLEILRRQIEIYNTFNKQHIEQHIIDLSDTEGNPAGTRFELDVPENFIYN